METVGQNMHIYIVQWIGTESASDFDGVLDIILLVATKRDKICEIFFIQFIVYFIKRVKHQRVKL